MVVEEVKINTGESTRTVKELRAELKSLKDQLLNTQQGTEEYSKTMQRAANIQKELKDQMQEVNNSAMDFGQKMGNATRVMAGVSGAITAATGALSLFGIENEEAQKKITATMTTLIGITQGLSKIDDGVKAFKRLTIAINASSKSMNGFKVALISTGLGALVVVLGSIIAYWDEFTEAIGLSAKQMERLGDIAKGVFNVFTSSLKGLAIALGKMVKGDFQGAWQALKDGFSVVKNFNEGVANAQAKREEALTKKQKEEAAKRAKIAEDEYKKRIELEQKLAKYERDMEAARTRGAESGRYTQGAFDRQMRYFDRLFAVYRKDSEEYRNLMLEKEQFLQDWENHWIEEGEKEAEAARKRAEDERKRLEDQKQREHEARISMLESFEEDLLTEQELLDRRYQMLMDAAIKEGRDTTAILKWYEEQKTKKQKEEAQNRKDIEIAEFQTKMKFAQYTGDILSSIGDMMEEGTAQQKGMAIAAATIQTLAGIATAISGAFTTKSGPWDIAIAAAQAAAIAASGAATITKIAAVKPDGSTTSLDVPNVNVGAVAASTPEFQPTMTGYQTQTAIADQRVYVLEHDITETQQKVQVAQNRATY